MKQERRRARHIERVAAGLAAVGVFAPAGAQVQSWLQQFGGFSDQYADALLKDRSGGVFVAGTASGDFLGPGFGGTDAYLAKFDDFGNPLWGIRFGSNVNDGAGLLAHAEGGGVFMAGTTVGSLGGPAAGDLDAWLARCDSTGTRLWIRQVGSAQVEYCNALVPDGTGGVFVGGATLGILTNPAPGGGDAWLARYDSTGRQAWLCQFGTSTLDGLSSFVPDGLGGLYACGYSLGPFSGPPSGAADAWVARFDSAGAIIWARQFGTAATDTAGAVCQDAAGGFFVAGFTVGSLGGPHIGDIDAWMARYDGSGDRLAITQFGTTGSDFVVALAPDGTGGFFMSGDTTGALGGPIIGLADAWIAHVNAQLNVSWVKQLGTPFYETASALAPAGPGGVFVCGYTDGNIITGGGSGGSSDAWLARYDTCYPDCNADGSLTVLDFGCFQTKFIAADPYADCNADGVLTVQDFGCFQTKFVQGCP